MTNLEKMMTDALANVLQIDARDISPSASFAECGLDSLSGLRFARRLEEKLGMPIELEWLFDHPTISELARLLEDRMDSPLRDVHPGSGDLHPDEQAQT